MATQTKTRSLKVSNTQIEELQKQIADLKKQLNGDAGTGKTLKKGASVTFKGVVIAPSQNLTFNKVKSTAKDDRSNVYLSMQHAVLREGDKVEVTIKVVS